MPSARVTVVSPAILVLIAACGSAADPLGTPPADEAPETPSAPVAEPSQPSAPAAPLPAKIRKQGVAFVHGTTDRGDGSSLDCSGVGDEWHCGASSGASYWGQATIDSERTRKDGSRRPWVAVGCQLSSLTPWPNPTPVKPKDSPPEPGSADCVGKGIATFLSGPDGVVGTEDDIDDIAIITHSGGGNVVRYILQQYSAHPEFERVRSASRGVVAIANPALGTYLADRVFGLGVLSVGNDVLGVGMDDDGVDFIQTHKMVHYNADPAKFVDVSKDIAGVPVYVAGGAYVDTDGDKDKVACGGANETKALALVNKLYFDEEDPATARNRCSDGFISCMSAMALANGDLSRVVFGKVDGTEVGETHYRAHNQSRFNCDGLDLDIRDTVNVILPESGLTSGTAGLVSSSKREPFAPLARSIHHRWRGLAVDTPVSAFAGEIARVPIDTEIGGLEGVLEEPTRETRLSVRIERDAAGRLIAMAALPPNARAGAWTLHLGSGDTHVRVPLWVSTGRGTLNDVHATFEGGGVLLRGTAKTQGAKRISVRATLVSETTEESWVVTSSQRGFDADPHVAAVPFGLFLPLPAAAPKGERLVVRDVALVSHDDASTLDLRSRVPVDDDE